MGRYVIKRLLLTIPIIVCVAFLIFTLMYFTPGDPAVMLLGDSASNEELEELREQLGINRPYIEQLADYFHRLFIEFDLGESWVYRTNITYEIGLRLPRTFAVCLYSILAGAVIGIPMGVAAAVNQNSWVDKLVLVLSSVMMCVPNYVYAILLIIVFSLHLRWLPAFGIGGIEYYILPCISILIGSFSGLARQMRSSMLEVIRSDYIMAAKAQGFSRKVVHYLHALPNAMIPIITMLGSQLASGLGGTMILETIFTIPGMGLYVQGAITKRDTPVVTGCVVFLAIWFCLIMVLLDVAYAAFDPRVRAQYEAQNEGSLLKLFKRRSKEK